MSFGKLRPKREQGISFFSGYRWAWGGSPWQPLLASAKSLQSAADSAAIDIAGAQTGGPGIYELAIAHKDQPTNYVTVYVGAAENIREHLLTGKFYPQRPFFFQPPCLLYCSLFNLNRLKYPIFSFLSPSYLPPYYRHYEREKRIKRLLRPLFKRKLCCLDPSETTSND